MVSHSASLIKEAESKLLVVPGVRGDGVRRKGNCYWSTSESTELPKPMININYKQIPNME